MRIDISDEAAAFVRRQGGTLWVWAERPRFCCGGMATLMKASTQRPAEPAGFAQSEAHGLDIRFRAPGGRFPGVLEIGLHGRRHPRVEAYWDGCLIMM
jgi:hypothetical protein